MRMSCNGCRVLRKGCSDNCSIRPCLQWIKSPDSQANATVFLAKFYGRAGLMNLINAGPEHLRPAIFRSLLYEACGRIVNPIYGSVGLLWSGSWQLCQAAVESVLKGAPITPIASEAAADGQGPPLKAYDIRHLSKDENSAASTGPTRNRIRVKRSVIKPKPITVKLNTADYCADEVNRSTSHESSVSHQSEAGNVEGDSKESESMVLDETAVAKERQQQGSDGEVELELTLGMEPISRVQHVVPVKKRKIGFMGSWVEGTCRTDLGLEYPV